MIPIRLLDAAQVESIHAILRDARRQNGKETAGFIAKQAKHNQQYHPDDVIAAKTLVLDALRQSPLIQCLVNSVAFTPVRFNRYQAADHYEWHTDDSWIDSVRTDYAYTLFLSDPQHYQGGELESENLGGVESIKLPAGELILYRANSKHRVSPILSGERIAAFGWMQSRVADAELRELIFELGAAKRTLFAQRAAANTATIDEVIVQLSRVEGSLLRRFGSS